MPPFISYIQGVATRGEILFGRLKFLGAKFPGCGIPNASAEEPLFAGATLTKRRSAKFSDKFFEWLEIVDVCHNRA